MPHTFYPFFILLFFFWCQGACKNCKRKAIQKESATCVQDIETTAFQDAERSARSVAHIFSKIWLECPAQRDPSGKKMSELHLPEVCPRIVKQNSDSNILEYILVWQRKAMDAEWVSLTTGRYCSSWIHQSEMIQHEVTAGRSFKQPSPIRHGSKRVNCSGYVSFSVKKHSPPTCGSPRIG
jgi:hypothetical protein